MFASRMKSTIVKIMKLLTLPRPYYTELTKVIC